MRDPIAQEMGRRIYEERVKRGWSQYELGAATGYDHKADNPVGISGSAIGNYEQGTRRITIDRALIFERVFGLPAAYFLCLLSKEEALIIKTMREARSKE